MKATIAIAFAAVFLFATVVTGQQQGQPPHPPNAANGPDLAKHPHPPNPDPLANLMFPPDMIMSHMRELGLTDEQKAFMRAEIQKTTASFQELQWKLQDQMDVLHDTMKSTSVNEQQALAQLDKVLEIEREIKRLHIGMAVRLKNRLTPEQQDQLHKIEWTMTGECQRTLTLQCDRCSSVRLRTKSLSINSKARSRVLLSGLFHLCNERNLWLRYWGALYFGIALRRSAARAGFKFCRT